MQSARNDKMRINSQRNLGAAMEQAAVGLPASSLYCMPAGAARISTPSECQF